MKLSSFIKDKPDRSITFSVLTLFALGYIFYFSACWLSQPAWAVDLILWLSPTVGGLARAAQVAKHLGNDPFPAQVIILYGAFGPIPWTVWFIYLFRRDRAAWLGTYHRAYLKLPRNKLPSKFKTTVSGLLLMPLVIFLNFHVAFWLDWHSQIPGWRDVAFWSRSFFSANFLLINMVIVSICIPMTASAINARFKFHEEKGIKQ